MSPPLLFSLVRAFLGKFRNELSVAGQKVRRSIILASEKRRFWSAMRWGSLGFLFHEVRGTGKEFECVIDGYRLRVRAGTTDFVVAWSNLKGGEFSYVPSGSYDKESAVIIDAGAYIGTASLALAKRFPGVRILALEPHPDNFRMMKKNVSQESQVIPIEAALARRDGDIDLLDVGEGHYAFTTVGSSNQSNSHKVQALSLATLLDRYGASRIMLLKLDIEGAEADLLLTGAKSLTNVDCVVAELHDFRDPRCSSLFLSATDGMEVIDVGGEKIVAYRKEAFINA